MPEGDAISTEVTVNVPLEEIRRDLMLHGVAKLRAAKYNIGATSDNTISFTRRYLPGLAQRVSITVFVLAALVQSTNGGQASPALAAGWIAVLTMIFYRRNESLTLDLRTANGATQIMAVGHVSKKGREALRVAVGAAVKRHQDSSDVSG